MVHFGDVPDSTRAFAPNRMLGVMRFAGAATSLGANSSSIRFPRPGRLSVAEPGLGADRRMQSMRRKPGSPRQDPAAAGDGSAAGELQAARASNRALEQMLTKCMGRVQAAEQRVKNAEMQKAKERREYEQKICSLKEEIVTMSETLEVYTRTCGAPVPPAPAPVDLVEDPPPRAAQDTATRRMLEFTVRRAADMLTTAQLRMALERIPSGRRSRSPLQEPGSAPRQLRSMRAAPSWADRVPTVSSEEAAEGKGELGAIPMSTSGVLSTLSKRRLLSGLTAPGRSHSATPSDSPRSGPSSSRLLQQHQQQQELYHMLQQRAEQERAELLDWAAQFRELALTAPGAQKRVHALWAAAELGGATEGGTWRMTGPPRAAFRAALETLRVLLGTLAVAQPAEAQLPASGRARASPRGSHSRRRSSHPAEQREGSSPQPHGSAAEGPAATPQLPFPLIQAAHEISTVGCGSSCDSARLQQQQQHGGEEQQAARYQGRVHFAVRDGGHTGDICGWESDRAADGAAGAAAAAGMLPELPASGRAMVSTELQGGAPQHSAARGATAVHVQSPQGRQRRSPPRRAQQASPRDGAAAAAAGQRVGPAARGRGNAVRSPRGAGGGGAPRSPSPDSVTGACSTARQLWVRAPYQRLLGEQPMLCGAPWTEQLLYFDTPDALPVLPPSR